MNERDINDPDKFMNVIVELIDRSDELEDMDEERRTQTTRDIFEAQGLDIENLPEIIDTVAKKIEESQGIDNNTA
jgi:hypothetical protein